MTIRKCLESFLRKYNSMLPVNSPSGENGFYAEFQKLQDEHNQWNAERSQVGREGWKENNRRKNRYRDIVPYDETRVQLSTLPGLVGSDYINASYIKGAGGHNSYIAAQGPLPLTTADFWRMVWEKNVHVIIMTCREEEGGKSKCERYWPFRGETKTYHDISVVMESEEQSFQRDYFIRELRVSCDEESRIIKQFHYVTWPDHDIPDCVTPMLDMVACIRDYQPGESTPLVVHCSAGCGRTGTLCAIDWCWSLLKLGKIDSGFNLYKVISDMRKQRFAMVQTREQYQFAYKAVAELFSTHLEIIRQNLYENVELEQTQPAEREDEVEQQPLYAEAGQQSRPTLNDLKITDEDYVNSSVLKKLVQMSPAMTNSIRKTVKSWEKHIKETDSIALRMQSRPALFPKPKTPDSDSVFVFQDSPKRQLEKVPPEVPVKQVMLDELLLQHAKLKPGNDSEVTSANKISWRNPAVNLSSTLTSQSTDSSLQTQENNKTPSVKTPPSVPPKQITVEEGKIQPLVASKPKPRSPHDVNTAKMTNPNPVSSLTQENSEPARVDTSEMVKADLPKIPMRSNIYEEIGDFGPLVTHNIPPKPSKPLPLTNISSGKTTKETESVDKVKDTSPVMPVAPPRLKTGLLKGSPVRKELPEDFDLYAVVEKQKKILNQETTKNVDNDEADLAPVVPAKSRQSICTEMLGFPKRINKPKGPRPPPAHWKKVM